MHIYEKGGHGFGLGRHLPIMPGQNRSHYG